MFTVFYGLGCGVLTYLAQYLMESGMLEAYEYVLRSLCKAGLPEGNIFDYTAAKLMKFETKWKTEQKRKAIVQKYQNIGKEKKEEDILPPIRTPKPKGKKKPEKGSKDSKFSLNSDNILGNKSSRKASPKKRGKSNRRR